MPYVVLPGAVVVQKPVSTFSVHALFRVSDIFALLIGKFASSFTGEEGSLGFCIYFLGI